MKRGPKGCEKESNEESKIEESTPLIIGQVVIELNRSLVSKEVSSYTPYYTLLRAQPSYHSRQTHPTSKGSLFTSKSNAN